MEYESGGRSFETLKLILALVLIVALAYVAYWTFTSDSLIPVDSLSGLEEAPSEKNKIDVAMELEKINFSESNISGEISNSIIITDFVFLEKAIISNDGLSWEIIDILGDKSDGWIVKNAKLPTNIEGKYLGLYLCKKDTRIGALMTGRWDCGWSFRQITGN